MKKILSSILAFLIFLTAVATPYTLRGTSTAYAQLGCDCKTSPCSQFVADCQQKAIDTSASQRDYTNDEFTPNEFKIHREWMVKVLFEMHILPALMLFAEQISAMAMHQVVVIGTFLDAKHQLETQRLFQELTARAHKDYQPSEGMCTFGTNMRSLAASDRNTDLSAMAISNRGLQRELLSADGVSTTGRSSDIVSRLKHFRTVYCNPKDNGNGLELLCPSPQEPERINKDINFTETFDAPLTLKMDFTEKGDSDHSKRDVSPDEEDVFALAANLYAHIPAPAMPMSFLTDEKGNIKPAGAKSYMDIRAIAAKRSVARNSFAAIAAMKSQGEKEVQPYLYALMKEMGISDAKKDAKSKSEIEKYLGERPSYHAQMEVMTKKLYQNPSFYTELYDKPANVARKSVSMEAIALMQKRDMYRSLLRSEAILSVMLETELMGVQESIENEINIIGDGGDPINLDD